MIYYLELWNNFINFAIILVQCLSQFIFEIIQVSDLSFCYIFKINNICTGKQFSPTVLELNVMIFMKVVMIGEMVYHITAVHVHCE